MHLNAVGLHRQERNSHNFKGLREHVPTDKKNTAPVVRQETLPLDTPGKEAEEAPPPFITRMPSGRPVPFLITVPHSGRHYPHALQKHSVLPAHDLRQSEDAFVDLLFEDIPSSGAKMIIATHARAYVDLNRAANEISPDLFHPKLNAKDINVSQRVKGGLGVIPEIVAAGVSIYDKPLPLREAEKRLKAVHQPYHAAIQENLDILQRSFNRAYLIDCHSMPSGHDLQRLAHKNNSRKSSLLSSLTTSIHTYPDIIIGDAWGAACDSTFTTLVEDMFLREGFSVRRNVPYSGGHATRAYGKPAKGIHALQIEINRSLYMDEITIEPTKEFHEIRARLTHALSSVITATAGRRPLAAE